MFVTLSLASSRANSVICDKALRIGHTLSHCPKFSSLKALPICFVKSVMRMDLLIVTDFSFDIIIGTPKLENVAVKIDPGEQEVSVSTETENVRIHPDPSFDSVENNI